MVRRSLIAAALMAVAAPLAAQSPLPGPVEWTWSSDRPDADAPLGVFGGRTMGASEVQFGYTLYQTNWQGVWVNQDSLNLATTLQIYDGAPLSKSDIRHRASLAYGVSDDLTLVARGEFAVMERETFANGNLIRTGTDALGDVEVGALYTVISQGPYRMHVQGGASIPIGAATTYADTTMAQSGAEAQPFDMRPGTGVFGAIAGITGSVQNERGSLGAQFRLRTNFGSTGGGTTTYTWGDSYEANGWAAIRVNQVFSVSGGARWQSWSQIDGGDDRLDPFGDPMNRSGILAGQRAMMPLGLNFMMPESSSFAGHRLSLEAVYTLHTDYEGPQMGLDWGFNFGWSYGM